MWAPPRTWAAALGYNNPGHPSPAAPWGGRGGWEKEEETPRKDELVRFGEAKKGRKESSPADALRTLALLQAELPLKKAAALAAEIHGVKKNALYKYALEQQG